MIIITSAIISADTSTVQFRDVWLTVVDKLVDQLVVSEDKCLQSTEQFTTSIAGDVVHVVDHAGYDQTFPSLNGTALGQLQETLTLKNC